MRDALPVSSSRSSALGANKRMSAHPDGTREQHVIHEGLIIRQIVWKGSSGGWGQGCMGSMSIMGA
jgi:hypothetical protein